MGFHTFKGKAEVEGLCGILEVLQGEVVGTAQSFPQCCCLLNQVEFY